MLGAHVRGSLLDTSHAPASLSLIELFSYSLSSTDLIILATVAVLLGMAKTGVAGTGMIAVPLMAISFGGRDSTGLALTLFIFADVFGVLYFHQHANWEHLRRLLPFSLIGVVLGTMVGNVIDDSTFKVLMAVIIFVSLPLMIWQEQSASIRVPTSKWFGYGVGVIGGFTTMVGNLAGPVMALYMLAMRFPKNQFIGTAAWFFFIINLSKVPFHVFAWGTITKDSLLLTSLFIPAVLLGAVLGLAVVKRIPEQPYRWFVIGTTAVAACVLLINS